MKKKQLIKYLKDFQFTYDYEEDFNSIYNACVDYMNDTQDWSIESCFENIITYDLAEDIARHELETGGLVRLYYFLGDANCNNDIFKIDGYGNLTDCHKDDLEFMIQDIIDRLED